MTPYLSVIVFVHGCMLNACVSSALNVFLPCAAVGLFISQPLPAKSVASPGYGPLVLIPAQMIDSPEGETTGLALWLAVNVLRVTLCHQGRKKRGRKAMKVTGEQAMVATGSGKKNQRNVGHPAKKLYINF